VSTTSLVRLRPAASNPAGSTSLWSVTSTPNATCRAAGNSAANLDSQPAALPGAGGFVSSR